MPDLTGNPAIDTAIGLAFAYFLLSLVVSSLTEAVSSVLQLRWKTLQRGIRELLLEGGEKSKQVLGKLDKVNKALTALDRGDLEKAKTLAKDLKLDLSASPDADELRKKLEDKYPHVTKFENNERIKALWKQTGFLANLPVIGHCGRVVPRRASSRTRSSRRSTSPTRSRKTPLPRRGAPTREPPPSPRAHRLRG